MRLCFSPLASTDLEEISDYISRENPSRAISFLEELEDHCRRIAELPSAYPLREDLAPGIRMAVHKKYLIFYRLFKDTVRIERIIHGARNFSNLL